MGLLRLRFSLMSTLTAVPRAVARFQREYPGVQLQLQPGGSAEQLRALGAGECDIGFMAFKRDKEPFATELLEQASLVAVLPTRHALAGAAAVELRALASERFVFLGRQSEPQIDAFFRAHCARAGFEPKVVMEVEQLEALLSFVAAGVGVSCAPALVNRLPFPGVRTVPLLPVIQGGISAVWSADKLSATGERFLRVLREELQRSKSRAAARRVK
ncbi:MAG TPA: LysR family substrate-binding domain-containing protein [Polyangiaceae bacterium]|nr:LysR family substrate-binding domain-containing protein [Polyangiaceae bacterium]